MVHLAWGRVFPLYPRCRCLAASHSPFVKGRRDHRRIPSAFSVPDEATRLVAAPSPHSRMDPLSNVGSLVPHSSTPKENPSASDGTPPDGLESNVPPTATWTPAMPAPSVSPPRIMLSPSPAEAESDSTSLPRLTTNADILNHIETPYNPTAFDNFFAQYSSLLKLYPHLTHKLRHGFPMGTFPHLKSTVIWPNGDSVSEHQAFIDSYFEEEVSSRRLSGPFSRTDIEAILGAPFQCSPLTVDVQPQENGEPKLRLCINLSKRCKAHPATNDYSDKKDFPTRFDSALQVAEIVSLSLLTAHLTSILRFCEGPLGSPPWSGVVTYSRFCEGRLAVHPGWGCDILILPTFVRPPPFFRVVHPGRGCDIFPVFGRAHPSWGCGVSTPASPFPVTFWLLPDAYGLLLGCPRTPGNRGNDPRHCQIPPPNTYSPCAQAMVCHAGSSRGFLHPTLLSLRCTPLGEQLRRDC